ncbi:hypothetical protein [Pseudoxanthomonas suwonensis]|uniref:hypothetical protein n=1 Tax=Pseudoxanthomonas suwonensis TaxID=314722 RepID=UPI0012DC333A|nr:hypothetical protein [Pseudoxanthomonas suwonensis]
MTGQEDPWARHVPALLRALADPALREALPRPANATLDDACAYWGALHYALVNLLGWQDVGAGLAWWYGAGKPVVDSPVLALGQAAGDAEGRPGYRNAGRRLQSGYAQLRVPMRLITRNRTK